MNFLLMGGYGLYGWSAFLFTFILCFVFFLRTKKTLKKLEKEFKNEAKFLTKEQSASLKESRVGRQILSPRSEIH